MTFGFSLYVIPLWVVLVTYFRSETEDLKVIRHVVVNTRKEMLDF